MSALQLTSAASRVHSPHHFVHILTSKRAMRVSKNEHARRMKGLEPLSTTGRSASIFKHKTEGAIYKLQYLLKVPSPRDTVLRYYSVQMFDDHIQHVRDSLIELFTRGKIRVRGRLAAKRRLAVVGAVAVYKATHDFFLELHAMRTAASAGVTPRLLEYWVVDTGHGTAIGVYKQEMAPATLESLEPCDMAHYMITQGPEPFVDLFRRCAQAGVLHIDILPSNIVVTASGPKLIDFGLSISSNPLQLSQPLRSAFYFVSMLYIFAASCRVQTDDKVFLLGCELPVTSEDFHILTAEFFPRLITAQRKALYEFRALWTKERGDEELPSVPTAEWVYDRTDAEVMEGAGKGGEKVFCTKRNTEIIKE